MNKYQEAKDFIENLIDDCDFGSFHWLNNCNCSHQNICLTRKKNIDLFQELIDQTSLIKTALLEGIETLEFGVIDNPFYISLKKNYHKDNSVCLNVYVKEDKLNHTYSLDSYGYLWKLKNDKWKEEQYE